MSRRKNPHPKRAVNARTVFKVVKGRREEEEVEEEEPLVLCLRIPDEDDDLEASQQIQKEETTFKKGTKRKRAQHVCDVCEKSFTTASHWKGTCVFTRTRNRTSVMFARSVSLNLVV